MEARRWFPTTYGRSWVVTYDVLEARERPTTYRNGITKLKEITKLSPRTEFGNFLRFLPTTYGRSQVVPYDLRKLVGASVRSTGARRSFPTTYGSS